MNRFESRDQLLAEIESQYVVTRTQIEFQGLALEVLKAADPDQVLEDAIESESKPVVDAQSWEPYWAEAWDSANAIGSWLIENEIRVQRVLDLGCGLGVAGSVAAHLGAQVVLGDSAPPAVMFAAWNSWPWRDRVQVRHLDWVTDRLDPPPFDLILAADIVYARENWAHQEAFCRNHLATGGIALFAEPSRRLSDEFAESFRTRGWEIQTWKYRPAGVTKPIRMHRCQLSDSNDVDSGDDGCVSRT